MLDLFLDALIDSLKLLPFLFVTYLLIEFIEHRSSEKLARALSKLGKFGSLVGGALGIVPQCGFSVAAANLYSGRIITFGTLVAVFVSTSDEAIPVLLSHPESYGAILPLIGVKLVLSIAVGVLVDFVLFRNKTAIEPQQAHEHIHEHCHDDCCKHGIFLAALKHTLSVYAFILIVLIAVNLLVYFVGEAAIASFIGAGKWYAPILAALIGFIPSCASSVVLTELFAEGLLGFGALIAGLVTNTGVALFAFFRISEKKKDVLFTALILTVTGLLSGLIIQLIESRFF